MVEGKKTMTRLGMAFVRLLIGALFAYAGTKKAIDPARFSIEIQNYRLIPVPWAAALALYLPWLEMTCGLALMIKRCQRGAICILIGSMLVFIAALGSAWFRGLNLSCGCFGEISAASNYAGWLSRDLLILGGLVALAREYSNPGACRSMKS